MNRLIIIITTFLFLSPVASKAQSSKYVIFGGSGGYKNHLTGNSSFRYGWRKNDSMAFEGGISWFNENLTDEIKGSPGITGRFVYTFDMLSIIPSFYLGLTAGYDFSSENPMMILEYGLSVDYLYSRKFRFGLSFGGYSFSGTDKEGESDIKTGWLIGIRLIWTLGEEW